MKEEKIISDMKETWSTIADVWTHLRAKAYEEVVEFCSFLQKPGLVLDIGCGNARNLVPFLERGFSCVGLDFSKSMIRKAKIFLRRRMLKSNFLVADMRFLPFKQKFFDYVLCTRILHHIPTTKLRVKSLEELARVAKGGAEVLVTVWRRYYPRFLIDFFSNIFERKFDFCDVYKKWKYHDKTYKIFYHLYSLEEFERELKEADFKISVIYPSDGNLIAKCKI
ncbi:MAG: class I SAM-dependent methyltransferase [Candidatus Aenigmarchaeota archaeon]|nr:class I SAM-dependent methyltransferase [Candidatus Aenigmarchaeota archaeon]